MREMILLCLAAFFGTIIAGALGLLIGGALAHLAYRLIHGRKKPWRSSLANKRKWGVK